MIAGAVISHLSKLQSIVALSTSEAEYVIMFEAGKETVWLGYLLTGLRFRKRSIPVTLYVDNKAQSCYQTTPNFTVVQNILMCNFTRFEKQYQRSSLISSISR